MLTFFQKYAKRTLYVLFVLLSGLFVLFSFNFGERDARKGVTSFLTDSRLPGQVFADDGGGGDDYCWYCGGGDGEGGGDCDGDGGDCN